ncbi:MAG: GNAT family N-acetyltransferase [Micromonosporaceae bacterium]|nr:GNAT family N-acetyltransferase [Micromonosporaceae bacterium]
MIIASVPYTDPEAQRLITAALADLSERYQGDGDATPIDPAQFTPPGGIFLMAWQDGVAVGCGGWRAHGEDAEIKRMYTAPEARGRGVARAVLNALEETARHAGKGRMILETGNRQPEAIGLYESQDYEQIPNFGYYKDEPGAVCYGLTL